MAQVNNSGLPGKQVRNTLTALRQPLPNAISANLRAVHDDYQVRRR